MDTTFKTDRSRKHDRSTTMGSWAFSAAGSLILLLLFQVTSVRAIDEQRLKAAMQAQPQTAEQPQATEQPGVDERDRDRIAAESQQGIMPRGPWRHWRLGIRVNYLETGARVTGVDFGSAAWRVGLERADVLVSINGYQIGVVNGRLYELSRELNLRANPWGGVRLLVWNHRNGHLVNVDVKLDSDRFPWPRDRSTEAPGTLNNSP